MTSSKQLLSQSTIHRVVHTSLKIIILLLVLVGAQFVNLGISEQEYGALAIVPVIGGMIWLLFKTILKTQHVRGDQTGFEVLYKGEWKAHSWQEVSHVGRAFWAFNPMFPVIEIQLSTDGEKVFLFGGQAQQEIIQSFRS